jgi:hypothetical protein
VTPEERQRRVREVLQRHDISDLEHSAMAWVGMREPFYREELAERMHQETGPDEERTPSECLAAVDSCIRKGWLAPLTEAERDRLAQVEKPLDYDPDERTYWEDVGILEFTEAGFRRYDRLVDEMYPDFDPGVITPSAFRRSVQEED